MNATEALNGLARAYGIVTEFQDLSGTVRHTSPETIRALLRANGLILDNDAMVIEAMAAWHAGNATRRLPREIVVRSGSENNLDLPEAGDWRLVLEGSEKVAVEGAGSPASLPWLPSGIHNLIVQTDCQEEEITLIAAPATTPSIEDVTGRSRIWGINAALFALRSERNMGLGDYEDLARLVELAGGSGAGFLGINPIHAIGWAASDTISPYSPSHRGFLNSAHIAPDQIGCIPESAATRFLLRGNEADIAALRGARMVDYPGHGRLQRALLVSMFELFEAEAGDRERSEFNRFCTERGKPLEDFTLYEALSEEHGPDWRVWPAELQSAGGNAVRASRQTLAPRMRFHAWLQWVADAQLSEVQRRAQRAGMLPGLYLDLAVGPRRGAAETWCEAGSVATGVSLGAPPDRLSPAGQNWNLAAYAPERLKEGRYAALRRVIAETMRHAGILRIDHVLGLNRSFWIPNDGSPGGYIRQPFESLLAVVAIEAERAATVVVGEDLGLVPEGFRDAINGRGLYSYSVLQYERDQGGQFRPPEDLPTACLACFGTHDTPTVQGYWQGRDIDWWQRLGWIDKADALAARTERDIDKAKLLSAIGKGGEALNADPVGDLHASLAESPVAMVALQLDDLLGEVESQNLPGTIDEHPNWRRRTSAALDEIGEAAGLDQVSRLMAERSGPPAKARKELA